MKKQSEAIEVSGSDLVEEMKQLKDKVQEVKAQSGVASLKASEFSGEVSNLMKANDKIVENIEQLSAVSEEVSENAQQASGLSNENIAQIKEAVQKVMCINDIIMELKKYQEK